MSILSFFKSKGPSGFGYRSTADIVASGLDLAGKRILITGCNSGIGFEAMKTLAARGAEILGAARTEQKALAAGTSAGVQLTPLACELSDLASVRACVASASEIGPIDVLMLNAGIMALPKLELVNGLERQFYTNHIGHFALATGLLESLSPDARVVVLSSAAHQMTVRGGIDFDNLDGARGYSGWRFYGQSKLANLLFARSLAHRFKGSARMAFAVHPGVIRTNLGRHMNPIARGLFAATQPLFLKTPQQGAATQVWAAVHPGAAAHSGAYLADCNVAKPSRHAGDEALAERLWATSEAIVARG